ncbi:hypothetical protein [Photobacterium damselae]|uniref:hypothetical protein n=1 Tax=Photobacterium damselae TaxID=38293 RepID=UPI001F1BB628|nr:hypothetical protein [Photobacterium damselae]UKA04001.1 hypothetical protein IHC89_15850 [Photobacterium damselae subsp. damselae]
MKLAYVSLCLGAILVPSITLAASTDSGTAVVAGDKATQTFQWTGTVPEAPTGTGYTIEKVAGSTDFNSGIIALKTNDTTTTNADIQSSSSMSFRLKKNSTGSTSDPAGYANSFTIHLENFQIGLGSGLVKPVDKTAGIELIATGDNGSSGQEVDLVDSKFDEYLVGVAGTSATNQNSGPAMATLHLESEDANGIVGLGAGEQIIVQATILVDNISGDFTL